VNSYFTSITIHPHLNHPSLGFELKEEKRKEKRTCKFCVEALGKTTGTRTTGKGKSICISHNPAKTVPDPAMRVVIVNSFIVEYSTSQVYFKGRRK
jgi:hypothetical protein